MPRLPRALVLGISFCLLLAACHCPSAADGERVRAYQVPYSYVDSAPAVGDINGDGKPEIVVNVLRGLVLALDGSFNEVWRQDLQEQSTLPPTIADLNGDGRKQVLCLLMGGRVVCLDGKSGRRQWAAKLPAMVNFGKAVIVAADFDGDGKQEVLATDSKDTMVCFSGTGQALWKFTDNAGMNLIPAVGDLYGDGKPVIVTGAMGAPIVCVSGGGKELWRVKRPGPVGKSHIIVDLDGDRKPEIVACVGNQVQAYTNRGKLLWSHTMKGEMYAGIAAADADGNGKAEVYAADMKGSVAALDGDGSVRWTAIVERQVHRSPAIADIDGDGTVEIIVAGYSGYLYVLDPRGRLEERLPMGGSTNGAPTVVDLAGDGRLGVCVPVAPTASLLLFQWSGSRPHPTVLWPEYRGNSARTAVVTVAPPRPTVTITDFQRGARSVGETLFAVRVANPQHKRLRLTLTVREGASRVARLSDESADPAFGARLQYRLAGRGPARYAYECRVTDGSVVVASRTETVTIVPFARESDELTRAITRLQSLLPKLPPTADLTGEAADLQSRASALRARVAGAGGTGDSEREALRSDLEALRDRAARAVAMAEKVVSAAGQTFFAIPANPWAAFGGVQELAEGREAPVEWQVEAFHGERESAAINLYNLSAEPLTVRVEVDRATPVAGAAVPARDVVTLREAVDSLTQSKDLAADALPKLNEARAILIPAWGARQLWITVRSAGLRPGAWKLPVSLRPSTFGVQPLAPELAITVWATALPAKQAAHLCLWESQGPFRPDQADALLQDQLDHGMSVFARTPVPGAKFDAQGNLAGPIDFAAHDAYVRPRAGHGIFLVGGPMSGLKGPAAYGTPLWRKAHAPYLRAWVAHLRELGVGYCDFAMYPVDEPGLVEGLVDQLVEYAQIVRDVDPKVRFYTDPVGGASLDEMKRMAAYVDIWTPSRTDHLLRVGLDKLAFLKATGKTVWTYEPQDKGRRRSALGYYRCQAWIAWYRGLTGFGFWTYNSGPSQWDGQDDYSLVYPGDGVIPSKRWEAVGDGVEDFTMLAAFREATRRAATSGKHTEAVKEAQALLADGCREVAWFCDVDEFTTLLDVDGFPSLRRTEDMRWQKLQSFRQRMAGLFVALGE